MLLGPTNFCIEEDDWVEIDVDLQNDVIMQLDAFDSTVSFWVWNAGQPQPKEPALSLKAVLDTGEVGVTGFNEFRYVRVEDTPIEDLPGDFNFDFQLDATDIDQLSAEIMAQPTASVV